MRKELEIKIPFNRIAALVIMDIMLVCVASFFSLFLRYEFRIAEIEPRFLEHWVDTLPVFIPLTLVVFWLSKLYKSVWRYASATELVNIGIATSVTAALETAYHVIVGLDMPRSYYLLNWFFLFWGACGIRFSYRMLRMIQQRRFTLVSRPSKGKNIMVIGAGAAGNAMIKEMQSSSYIEVNVACVIDDQVGCHGKLLRGVPIVGGRDKIIEAVEDYAIEEIVIAVPSAEKQELREILSICKETGCKLKMLPGMYQLINGEVSISKLKEVQIEDLLGREPIKINSHEVSSEIKGKVVMVTGGGGSIGSELCRQIASYHPKQLVIIDIYENNLYEIQQNLLRKYPKLDLVALIASVRNTSRVQRIMEKYHPEIVFHAAAHKHVPLMEESPSEAIKNNVFGTLKTALAAGEAGVKKFVLISTDKAVNPTNVMGASKRICEMIVQMCNQSFTKTDYVSVRFGNVLGSNGSVIPLFKKQIEEGGPVTVTHPDIIRYFMTIPEAISLILQATSYAKGGEIFVLDMGEPMKIVDLAKNLIKLSGYRVGEEIEIVYTGLRPGEKMYEELLLDSEKFKETPNKKIFIGLQGQVDAEYLTNSLYELKSIVETEQEDKVRVMLGQIVETYCEQ